MSKSSPPHSFPLRQGQTSRRQLSPFPSSHYNASTARIFLQGDFWILDSIHIKAICLFRFGISLSNKFPWYQKSMMLCSCLFLLAMKTILLPELRECNFFPILFFLRRE